MMVGIIGSRDYGTHTVLVDGKVTINPSFGKQSFIEDVVKQLNEVDYVVSGGALGADSWGEEFARNHNVGRIIHAAQWKVYGRSAGPIRNSLIVRDADIAFAFYTDKATSRGTVNCVGQFRKAGKPVYEFDAATEEEPEWLSNLESLLKTVA